MSVLCNEIFHPLKLAASLDHLLKLENAVLEFWTMKKKHLDHCQQFVLFESSAKQVNSEKCRTFH